MKIALMPIYTLLFLIFLLGGLKAQENSHVYLLELSNNNLNELELERSILLTAYNGDGANDYPLFLGPDKLMISSKENKAPKQYDLYELNLRNKNKTRVTQTIEDEIQPAVVSQNRQFSALRVEKDFDGAKRLWMFSFSRNNQGKAILPFIQDVNNYVWINSNFVALQLQRDNGSLVIAKVKDESIEWIEKNVGDCLQQKNGSNNLYYLHKEYSDEWYIKELLLDEYSSESNTGFQSKMISPILRGVSFFEVLPNKDLICAKGSKLYIKKADSYQDDWKEWIDLRALGIRQIKRIEAGGNSRIAIVAN